jgi:hypothetical protein
MSEECVKCPDAYSATPMKPGETIWQQEMTH